MSSLAEELVTRGIEKVEFEKLLEQLELLDATELIAQMGHCQWDYKNNRLLSCSDGYARIYNMSVEEILELQSNWHNSLTQIHPDDQDRYLEAYRSQQETGNYNIEYRLVRNDGKVRWLREVGILRSNEIDDTAVAFAIIQDVTEKVMRQGELEDRQELARQVEAITDIGHFINDEEDDKFLYISPGYARIHGHTVDSFIQFVESRQDNLAAVHDEDRETLRAEIIKYVEAGDENFESEYRIVRPDGEIIWIRERSKSSLNKNGQVKITLGVLQDITEKKNYEQNLQQARDSLEATVVKRTRQLAETVSQLQQEITERKTVSSELEAKNAELERFAYTVSHDLKAPLVTIKGFIGLLEKDLATQDVARATEDIEKIKQAADTMARLLEELLELSRIGHVVGESTTCGMTEVALRAVQLVETEIVESGIEVVIDDMPEVCGDETRLIEVYQNLLGNAIKFMGGQQTPRIHIGAKREHGRTFFFVSDNGIGISAEYHQLVFELFERLSADADGTGVGLTLVRRIIEVHGGKIWVESEGPGHGSTLWFTLGDLP